MNALDHQLTVYLNSLNAPWLDPIMVGISETLIWLPFFAFLIYWLFRSYKRQAWRMLLFIALLILLCDRLSVMAFKDVFCRLRPCHDPLIQDLLNLPKGCGGAYGFVSSHACNYFGLATLLTSWFRYDGKFFRYGALFVWAALIGYSRIYLGVHFLGDVLCGGLLGCLIGWSVSELSRCRVAQKYGLSIHQGPGGQQKK